MMSLYFLFTGRSACLRVQFVSVRLLQCEDAKKIKNALNKVKAPTLDKVKVYPFRFSKLHKTTIADDIQSASWNQSLLF